MISICINCNKEINYLPSQRNGKYCSNVCQGDYSVKAKFCIGSKWNYRMSLYLKRLRGEKCEECGLIEWNNKKIIFQVDHINGDRTDNQFSNLKILCPNCHSQTETYGAKNVSEEGKQRQIESGRNIRLKQLNK